jgi:putative peptidoglycan lipid II flippase
MLIHFANLRKDMPGEMRAIAEFFAPGFDERSLDLSARLISLVAPGAIFLSLSTLTYITLNAYRRFALPALGDLAWKAGPMAGVLLLVRPLGITALAVGYLIGALGRFLVHCVGLAKHGGSIALPDQDSRRDLSRLTFLMLPLVLGSGFAMVSDLADNFFSSMLGEGGVAARSFAKKLKDLPLEVIPYTLSVVLFPYFAHLAATRDQDRLYELLGKAARGLAAFFAAVGVCIVLLPEPIVSLALERGAFDVDARERTAWALQMYGLGMITFALETILVNFYFAVQDTVTPVVMGMAGVLVNILLSYLLIEPLGVGGVALAQSISKTLKIAALALLLQRKRAMPWRAIATSATVVATGIVVASVGLWLFRGLWTTPLENMSLVAKASLVGSGGLVGTVLCLGTIVLIGRHERDVLWLAVTQVRRLRRRER